MNPTLQKAIDRMPTILVNNAISMIRRMLAAMKVLIAERAHQANASHGMLFLKVGEEELVREFGLAMEQSVEKSRMDRQAMAELMPYARHALNAELCKVYAKLESVGVAARTTPA